MTYKDNFIYVYYIYMLSRKLFDKYEKHPIIRKIVNERSFTYLTDQEKKKISSEIQNIQDMQKVESFGYSSKVKRNVDIIEDIRQIEKITIAGKNNNYDVKKTNIKLLLNRKTGKKAQRITNKKKQEIDKMLFQYLKSGKAQHGKLNISNVVYKELDINITFMAILTVETGGFNVEVERGLYTKNYVGANSETEINQFIIDDIINKFTDTILVFKGFRIVSITNNKMNDKEMEFHNMKLREENPINLINLFGEKIDLNKSKDNCVKKLFESLPEIQKKQIDKLLSDKDYITPTEIYEFCKKNIIKCIIYDIDGKVLFNNKIKSHHFKPFYLLAFNEHCYPLKNEYFKSKKTYKFIDTKKNIMTQEEIDKKFMQIIKSGVLPAEIQTDKSNLFSFIHNDEYYFVNEDYEICEKVLKSLGLEENLTMRTKRNNLINILIPLYNNGKINNSFFPYEFTKDAYVFHAEKFDEKKKIKCIDGIKFYSQCLKDLPYLIYTDVRYSKINTEIKEITEHYLYNIEIVDNCILAHTNGVYTGKIIKKLLDEKINIKIKEEITTIKRDNFYKKMIEDIYNMDIPTQFKKDMCNIHIGKMAMTEINNYKKQIITCYCPNAERQYRNTKEILINGKPQYFEIEEVENNNVNIVNNYPINIQIKDFAHQRLADKINDMGLTDDDIVSILTDAIYYYDNDKINFQEDSYWKEKEINENDLGKSDPEFRDKNKTFSFRNMNGMIKNNNVLVDGYAGMGKSHYIKNKLIPNIDDYIVLSPSHSTIKSYRQDKYNCNVIQTYTNTNKLPQEKNIIVDEYGMMDSKGWIMLIKCMVKGKRLFLFGDKNQLEPPFEEYRDITDDFLNNMFNKIIKCKANWRNNIDVKLYEKLMSESCPKSIIDKLLKMKYVNSQNPNIYIGIRKKTCEKKNLEILEQLGKYKDGKFINLEDTPVLCKCNNYGKYELYNNFKAKIKSYDEEKTIIEFEGKEIEIKTKIFHKRFNFCYAINIHAFQGEEDTEIKFLEDDKDLLFHPKVLYTLISRFKEELSDEQKAYNKTCEYNIDIGGYDDILA